MILLRPIRERARAWFGRRSVRWQVRLALVLGLSGTNAMGILVVCLLLLAVLPVAPADRSHLLETTSVLSSVAYAVVFAALGVWQAWVRLHPVATLIEAHVPLTERDQLDVLAAPRRIFLTQAGLWAAGSVLVGLQHLQRGWVLGLSVFLVVGLAGWTTSCMTYLVAERALRPVASRVLREGFPSGGPVRSVASRVMFAWALGTGASALGIVLTAGLVLVDSRRVDPDQLSISIIVLGLITLVVGGLSATAAAQATSEPIGSLRQALDRVDEGDLDVEVAIYDGTEIGLLQAGFNQTVGGLRQREELRDLFGRHVGADVARAAMESGVELGGETREVAVLFVDIVGSTSLAERRPPEEVVGLLNEFFEVVIDVVHAHDGWINKFAGDAALAVWGAPAPCPHQATAALTAAREMGARLAAEVEGVRAGIGVSMGTAVAGNVGTAERYEYTVIGDPVNEASRLSDHAKDVDGLVVASCALVDEADEAEARRWTALDPVTVRGRSEPTAIAAPR